MKLKRAQDIEWRDLPKIEHPFFARGYVERVFFDRFGAGGRSIWGIDDVLGDDYNSIYAPDRDPSTLARLLELVKEGEVFLVHGITDPFSPVVRWEADEEDKDKGRWVVMLSNRDLSAQWHLGSIVHSMSPRAGGGRIDATPSRSIKPQQGDAVSDSTAKEAASLGLDVLPVVGTLKGLGQVIAGKDLVTGEPVNRGVEALGLVASLIPVGQGVVQVGRQRHRQTLPPGSQGAGKGIGKSRRRPQPVAARAGGAG